MQHHATNTAPVIYLSGYRHALPWLHAAWLSHAMTVSLHGFYIYAGMAVELASPFFPSAFLAMACIGSMCRAMTGAGPVVLALALGLAFWGARLKASAALRRAGPLA